MSAGIHQLHLDENQHLPNSAKEMVAVNPFERVICISLKRRHERWAAFIEGLPDDWPFGEVERYEAVDGKLCKPPNWFTAGGGAWGCNSSAKNIIEDCLNRGINSVLLFEDDAVCTDDLARQWEALQPEIPDDWEVFYLGGQLLSVNKQAPQKVSEHVYRPYNVNRTHAWALRGNGLTTVYRHLCSREYGNGRAQIIDNHMGKLLTRQTLKIYCPDQWLFFQRDGHSDICNKKLPLRKWEAPAFASARLSGRQRPKTIVAPNTPPVLESLQPFVAILGIHSSGTSATAGLLWHLGVDLGDKLVGYYGSRPGKNCGYEAIGLVGVVRKAVKWPETHHNMSDNIMKTALRRWYMHRQRTTAKNGKLPGGKHPLMCAMSKAFRDVCGDSLKVVHVNRPLEESIESFVKRESRKYPADQLEAHQRWLHLQKEEFLLEYPNHLTVEYSDLLSEPQEQAERVIEYLGLAPSEEQLKAAIRSVRPEKRHICLEAV